MSIINNSLPDLITALDQRIQRQNGTFSQLGHRKRDAKEIDAAVKRSKFTKLLAEMSDEQVKILTFALVYDDQIVEAVNCFQTANCNEAQLVSLKRDLERRGITLSK